MSIYVGKELSTLGNRAMYNRTMKHMVHVTSIVDAVEKKGKNLADVLNQMIEDQVISREQVAPILSVVLISRMNVPVQSINIKETISDFSTIVERFSRWNAVDLVAAFHHPNLGLQPINPAEESHWEYVHELKRDELLVVYARSLKGKRDIAEKALQAFFDLLEGKSPQEDPDFVDASIQKTAAPSAPAPSPAAPASPGAPGAPGAPPASPAPPGGPAQQASAPAAPAGEQKPAQAPAAQPAPAAKKKAAGKRNLSPRYSVQVTNELFHNGNVEAWKNIIEAYEAKTGLQVIVYHEGELIQDLNSLFKWGKVKHGGIISFQVSGEPMKFVSRLQKYLFEGASSRFEAFLKKDINKILNIF